MLTYISSIVRSGFHKASMGRETLSIPQKWSGSQEMCSLFHLWIEKQQKKNKRQRETEGHTLRGLLEVFVKYRQNSLWQSKRKEWISGLFQPAIKEKFRLENITLIYVNNTVSVSLLASTCRSLLYPKHQTFLSVFIESVNVAQSQTRMKLVVV